MNKHSTKILGKYIPLVAIFVLIVATITAMNFIVPYTMKKIVENNETKTINMGMIILLLLVYAGIYFVQVFYAVLQKKFSIVFKSNEMISMLRMMFKMKYGKLIELEPTYLVEKINISVNILYDLFANSFASMLVNWIVLVICIVPMTAVNPILGVLFALLLPVQYFSYRKLNQSLEKQSIELQNVCAKNFMTILNIVSNTDYIKQVSNIDRITHLLSPNVRAIHTENAKVNYFANFASKTFEFVISIIKNGIYIYSVFIMLDGTINLSTFIFINLISGIYFPTITQLVNTNVNLRDLRGAEQFIINELLANEERDGTEKLEEIIQLEVCLKDVGYNGKILFKKCEFTAQKGDVIGIVGKSGCGKSTLAKTLLRFYDFGSIKINGIEIKDINLGSLRSKIAYYSQNVPIIPGKIRSNLFINQDESQKGIEKLRTLDFLNKFTDDKTLDEIVLENGANLSGGDKQKIAIARAFIESPDVIILDEITTSIDAADADKIMKDLVSHYRDKIVFIISHNTESSKFFTKTVAINGPTLV